MTTSKRQIRTPQRGKHRKRVAENHLTSIELVGLAHVLQEAGRLEDALVAATRALFSPSATASDRAWAQNARGQVLQALGRYSEAESAREEMARIATQARDVQLEGSVRFALGSVAQQSGDWERAGSEYAAAFRLLRAAGDIRSLLQILLNLTEMRLERGQIDRAGELLASAGEFIDTSGDAYLRAAWNGLRGNWLVKRGNHQEAAKAYKAALRAAKKAGAALLALQSYQNLGAVHIDLGKPATARRWYENGIASAVGLDASEQCILLHRGAATAADQTGDRVAAKAHLQIVRKLAAAAGDEGQVARAGVDLAGLALNAGDDVHAQALLDEAQGSLSFSRDAMWLRQLWRHRLKLASRAREPTKAIAATLSSALQVLADPQAQAALLDHAAEAMAAERSFGAASAHLKKAMELRRSALGPAARALASAEAGALLLDAGGAEQAIPFFAAAMRTYARLGDDQFLFRCKNDCANALAATEQYARATRLYRECLELGKRLHDRVMIAQSLMNWGETLRRARQPEEAIRKLRRAARTYQALGDVDACASTSATLGLAWKDVGNDGRARKAFEHSRALARRAGSKESLAVALGGLADLSRDAGKLRQAIGLYRRTIAIEQALEDPDHEAETQAGLLVALARAGDEKSAVPVASRLVKLTQMIGRAELATWSIEESGESALQHGHAVLAAELFALSIVLPFIQLRDEVQLTKAAPKQIARVALLAFRHDAARFDHLINRISRGVQRLGGQAIGKSLVALLRVAEKAVHEASERQDKRRRRGTRARRRTMKRDSGPATATRPVTKPRGQATRQGFGG